MESFHSQTSQSVREAVEVGVWSVAWGFESFGLIWKRHQKVVFCGLCDGGEVMLWVGSGVGRKHLASSSEHRGAF